MIISVSWRRGKYPLWLLAAAGAPVFFLLSRFALFLDPLLFPALRRMRVESPVFIFGHPRSGTTFLQGLVSLDPRVASFRTWEMFFPSIILRRAVQPFIALAEAVGLWRIQHAKRGHEIALTGVNEEEGLFLHHLDSELLTYVCPEGLLEPEYRGSFLRLGWNDKHGRREPVAFFKEYLRRQLYLTGTRKVILNTNPSVFRIRSILKVFPDARFVIIHRSPEQTLPSYLSLLKNTVGARLTAKTEREFYRQKYLWSLHFYRHLQKARPLIPAESLMELDFHELVGGPEETRGCLDRIFRFSGIEPSKETWAKVRRELEKKRSRAHRNYSLETFGLSRERLRQDFAFYSSV
jgi:omega-hydroxy-beta-dihydromenaquinone-9 sulfotransferase